MSRNVGPIGKFLVETNSWNQLVLGSTTGYGTDLVAIGRNISAGNTQNSVVIGNFAVSANGGGSVTIGRGARDYGAYGVIIGTSAVSGWTGSVIIGYQATGDAGGQSRTSPVVIGYQSQVWGDEAVVIGYQARGSVRSTSLGYKTLGSITSATAGDNTSIGWSAGRSVSSGQFNTFLGSYAGYGTTGPGTNATTSANGQVLIGYNATLNSTSQSSDVIAIGNNAKVSGTGSIALGKSALANANGAVAIGSDSTGTGATTSTINEIALGTTAHVTKTFGGRRKAYVAKTTTYSIAVTDHIINCTSGTFTATLPTAVGITGQEFIVVNSGSGSITIATTSSQTINGTSTATLNQWDRITVVSDGANWIRTA